MLTALCAAYVGRFARDWHRLATTEPANSNRPHYNSIIWKMQAKNQNIAGLFAEGHFAPHFSGN
jgi:hypothetical protein